MTDPEVQLVKISELAKLSGVAAPTIKHYMREGLLPGPAQRTSRNMSYYDPRLAARVRAIKDLQQSHFLPLRMIGDVLEPAPSPEIRADLDEETRARLGGVNSAIRQGIGDSRSRRGAVNDAQRTRADVLATRSITAEELAQLDELGLARATRSGRGKPYYTGVDLDLVEIIIETRDKGMGELFPMSILSSYIAEIQRLVRMELDLFRARLLEGATLPVGSLNDVARDATHLAERMIIAIRSKLVFAELDALSGGKVTAPASTRPSGPAPRGKRTATPGHRAANSRTKSGAKRARR